MSTLHIVIDTEDDVRLRSIVQSSAEDDVHLRNIVQSSVEDDVHLRNIVQSRAEDDVHLRNIVQSSASLTGQELNAQQSVITHPESCLQAQSTESLQGYYGWYTYSDMHKWCLCVCIFVCMCVWNVYMY